MAGLLRCSSPYRQFILNLEHSMGGIFSGCSNRQPVSNNYISFTTQQKIQGALNERSASRDGTLDQALADLKRAGASESTLDKVRTCVERKGWELILEDAALLSLPASVLRHLGHLERFVMDGCQVEALPEDFGCHFPRLKSIFLCNVPLPELPESLGNLSTLTRLSVYECDKIHTLPESLGNLKNLSLLWIKQCASLRTLPEILGKLSSLRDLQLDRVGLERLPASFTDLPCIRELTVEKSPSFVSLPDDIEKLTTLYALTITGCGIKEFPANITKLSQLGYLICFDNQLESLPEDIGNLVELDSLSLSGNRLTRLPDSITRLPYLASLSTFNNPFTEVPRCITDRIEANRYVDFDAKFIAQFSRDTLEKAHKMIIERHGPPRLGMECEKALLKIRELEEICEERPNPLPSII
jgi:hypothetical protein